MRDGIEPVISLFSGAMGLDLGLERVGVRPALAIEIDELCCETMRRNRPGHDVWRADASELDAAAILARVGNPADVSLMVGGPPCQSFSPGGKRAALSDPRGNLIYVYLKLVKDVRPRFFVLENVANIVTAALRHRPIAERPGKKWNLSSYEGDARRGDGSAAPMEADELSGSAIRQIMRDVTDLGYHLSIAVADAADYGASQHRLRFIMCGAREGPPPSLPVPSHGERSIGGPPLRTVRDAVFDLQDEPGPHSVYTPEVARYFSLVPPGGNWRHLPRDLQREALGDAAHAAGGGKTGFYRRLAWDAPSPTITGRANRKGSALCHPEAIRPLSVRECARLQGFPDDWAFSGSMNRQYMQVGNAVPVPLGEAIGKAVLDAAAGGTPARHASASDLEYALTLAVDRLRASARNKRPNKKKNDQPTLF